MSRRGLRVWLGIVAFLGVAALAFWWAGFFHERPSVEIARRLGFGGFGHKPAVALSEAVYKDPASVLPRLVPLLEDSDEAIRRQVGLALADSLLPSLRRGVRTGLTNDHLPALISAYQQHIVGARTAIGLVRTPEAADFLISEFRREGQSTDVWRGAFRAAGELGRVRLAAILREPTPVDGRLRDAICALVRGERENAKESTTAFLAVANDPTCAPANRQTAVVALGWMFSDAGTMLPELETLAASDSALFDEVVRVARIRIAGERTLAWYELELQSPDCDGGPLFWYGFGGAELRPLGPLVLNFLRHPDWAVRVVAARGLGRIGYREAAPALAVLLSDHDDSDLVSAACVSLGQLRAEAALPELERVAREYWAPWVRAAARRAIDVIRVPSDDAETNRRLFPDMTTTADERRTAHEAERAVVVPKLNSSPGEIRLWHARAINRWVDYAQWAFDQDELQEWNHEPSCGIKFAGGYLLGVNEGEFGYGVLFVKDGQVAKYFPTGCVTALHRMPFGVVIVTTFALDGGVVACVAEETAESEITVRPFKRLPDGPGKSGLLPNGDLYIDGVVISREGSIRRMD